MGLSFDGNGKYVGWSTLFDYSSLEALKASEYLPMPKRKVYKITDNGFNIDQYINRILEKEGAERVDVYVELLNYLNNNDITDLQYTKSDNEEVAKAQRQVIQNIMDHEFTKVPYSLREDSNKNFISSHIQNTVQNLRNMIGAYSPIEMEAFREASESSPKGEQASRMTLYNPATKLLMQYQNITGKNVIGIAANGEKASFMWHYYLNDIIHQVNPAYTTYKFQDKLNKEIDRVNREDKIQNAYIDAEKYLSDSTYRDKVKEIYKDVLDRLSTLSELDELATKIKYATFSFTTSRIKGRSTGNVQSQQINTLPDVNFEGVDDRLRAKFGYNQRGDITVDLMISQILSAATDLSTQQ